MENILEQVIKYYKNYTNLTKKTRKLQTIRRAVDILKDQLGGDIESTRIRWLASKGEAEAVLKININSKIGSLLCEIWEYLFSDCTIESIYIVVATYKIEENLNPMTNEELMLIFGTKAYNEETVWRTYYNYIPVCEYVDDEIKAYIYIRVEDKCNEDDC